MADKMSEKELNQMVGQLRSMTGPTVSSLDAADAIAQLRADLATLRTQNAALEIDRQHAVCKMRNMERERDEARALIAEYAVACREYSDAEDDYLEGDVTTTLEREAGDV
jgi:hypothetical protein